jgi:lysophospholipase L1-like esterase
MAKFKKWDTQNSFPQDAVLFVGSSSIVGWPTRQSFPDLPVINRGFGGSIYSDIVHYADTVIFPYSPKLIVFYSGDTDPYWGKSPEQIAADFKQLKNLVHQKLPQVPIIVMAAKISESRISRAEDFKKANAMLKETAQADKLLHYFDSASILLDKQGNPIPEFFRSDKLHLSEEGYKVWTQNIRPLIDELMSAKPAAENRD